MTAIAFAASLEKGEEVCSLGRKLCLDCFVETEVARVVRGVGKLGIAGTW